jgi:hypothetical protein
MGFSHVDLLKSSIWVVFVTSCVFVICYISYFVLVGAPLRDLREITQADYVAYLTGAEVLVRGEGRRLYNLGLQGRVVDSLFATGYPGTLPYLTLPFVAVMFVPFTYLTVETGYKIFFVINLLVLAWGTVKFGQLFGEVRRLKGWWILPFASLYFIRTVAFGQISTFLLVGVLYLYQYLINRDDFRAGMATGVLLLKPQLLVFVPFLVLLSKRRAVYVLGFLLVSMVLLVVSMFISGADFYRDYFILLQSTHTESELLRSGVVIMYSLFALIEITFPSLGLIGRYGINFLVYFAAFVIFAAFYKKFKRPDNPIFFAIALIFSVVFCVHIYLHDMLLLLIPVFVCFNKYLSERDWRYLLAGGVVYFLPYLGEHRFTPYFSLLLLFVGVVLLKLEFYEWRRK